MASTLNIEFIQCVIYIKAYFNEKTAVSYAINIDVMSIGAILFAERRKCAPRCSSDRSYDGRSSARRRRSRPTSRESRGPHTSSVSVATLSEPSRELSLGQNSS